MPFSLFFFLPSFHFSLPHLFPPMFLVAFLLFSAPSVIPFLFVLFHSYLFSFNSISPSVIKKGFTFSLLNTDEEHQKALKDLEVARRNLQVFFTVLMMFLPHCKAYFKWSYSGSQDVFLFLCLQFETFNVVNIDFSWDSLLYFYNLSFSIFWCMSYFFTSTNVCYDWRGLLVIWMKCSRKEMTYQRLVLI